MANIVFGDEETHERFHRCVNLPVDDGKMTLSQWVMWKLSGYNWDDTVTLYYDPYEENWFAFVTRDKDGNKIINGGLIYRDNGWESHT